MRDPYDLSDLQHSIAILGGSFDPIHLGHLHLARQILKKSPIREVLFVPSGNHNFKKDSIYLSFANRYELVRQAIENEPGFSLSAADREGSGYTAHLMQRLKAENPNQNYVFVIGSDNLPSLHKWFDYLWLQSNLQFLVLPRPDFEIRDSYLDAIEAFVIDIEPCPISSTEIRNRLKRGDSIRGLVPEQLEPQISELFRQIRTAKEIDK